MECPKSDQSPLSVKYQGNVHKVCQTFSRFFFFESPPNSFIARCIKSVDPLPTFSVPKSFKLHFIVSPVLKVIPTQTSARGKKKSFDKKKTKPFEMLIKKV